MDFSFNIEGIDKLKTAFDVTSKQIEQEVNKALYASAKQVETVAKKSIQNGQKSGRVYKRGNVTHHASAPGEPPATDTGRLVNSINSYLNAGENEAFVTAGRGTVNYAPMLEFGTWKMPARPFMLPALEQCRAWISDRLAKAVAKAIDAAKK